MPTCDQTEANTRPGALTCVQGQVSGESLLSAKHFSADGAREELFIQSPLGDPVAGLSVVLFRVCKAQIAKRQFQR